MIRSRQVGVLLLAASLTGCGSFSMFDTSSFMSSGFGSSKSTELKSANTSSTGDTDTTGSASQATSPPKSDGEALNSLFARAALNKPAQEAAPAPNPAPAAASTPAAKPVVVADARDTPVSAAPTPAPANVKIQPRGRAYLFRGVAGLIYSRGIDTLAARIRRTGIPASVGTYLLWRPTLDEAIRDYRRDPQPIILIGHSMGGDCVLDFAEMLNQAGIPVSLLVTYDPTRIADDVPPNVERYINIYQSSNFMGGGNVVQGSRFHGDYASYNLKDHAEIVHINIEKADRIQEQLVAKVAQLAQTPADAQGEAVPIHLEVPADAAIELWDSGLPVAAHAGDTLKTLAATYHVPLWALAQINSVPEREPLSEGQRIVVPRHLVPMQMPSTVTSYAPAGR
jgi:hypothetical protein